MALKIVFKRSPGKNGRMQSGSAAYKLIFVTNMNQESPKA